jgi:hypothetical protein
VIFIRLDENISPRVGRCVEAIKIRQGVDIQWPGKDGTLGAKDPEWMTALGKRGGESDVRIIISQDGFTDPERVHAEINKISVFYVPHRAFWGGLKKVEQAAYLLRWLARIIELAETSAPGTQFALPSTFNTRVKVKTYKALLTRKNRRGSSLRRKRRLASTPLLDRMKKAEPT